MKERIPWSVWLFCALGLAAWALAGWTYARQLHISRLADTILVAGAPTLLRFIAFEWQSSLTIDGLLIVGALFFGFAGIVAQLNRGFTSRR